VSTPTTFKFYVSFPFSIPLVCILPLVCDPCAGWEYIVPFTKVLAMYQMYHTHSPPCSLLSSPLLIPGLVSTGIIFTFTYMCTHFLYHSHPPILFPTTSLLPLVPIPAHTQDLFHLLLLWFCRRKKGKAKKKNMKFLPVWDRGSYTGSFLSIFPYIYNNPIWFSSSNFLHSTLVLFLWWSQAVYRSFCMVPMKKTNCW
jgi:hypothetical protein